MGQGRAGPLFLAGVSDGRGDPSTHAKVGKSGVGPLIQAGMSEGLVVLV